MGIAFCVVLARELARRGVGQRREMMEFLKTAALFFFYLALLVVAALGILGLGEIVLQVHAALQRRKHVRR